MAYPQGTYEVFIDESGNLGFGPKASRTFVVAYVVTTNPFHARNKMSRLKKNLNQRKLGLIQEFKFSRDSDETKEKVVAEICDCDFDLGYIVIDKAYVKESLRRDPPLLYRYLVVNYVVTSLVNAYDISKIRFTVDRSLTGRGIAEFNGYLTDKLSWRQVMEKGADMPSVEIAHADSQGESCLQIADYCSGAAYSNFERGNPYYYDLIKAKTKFKTPWGNIDW